MPLAALPPVAPPLPPRPRRLSRRCRRRRLSPRLRPRRRCPRSHRRCPRHAPPVPAMAPLWPAVAPPDPPARSPRRPLRPPHRQRRWRRHHHDHRPPHRHRRDQRCRHHRHRRHRRHPNAASAANTSSAALAAAAGRELVRAAVHGRSLRARIRHRGRGPARPPPRRSRCTGCPRSSGDPSRSRTSDPRRRLQFPAARSRRRRWTPGRERSPCCPRKSNAKRGCPYSRPVLRSPGRQSACCWTGSRSGSEPRAPWRPRRGSPRRRRNSGRRCS